VHRQSNPSVLTTCARTLTTSLEKSLSCGPWSRGNGNASVTGSPPCTRYLVLNDQRRPQEEVPVLRRRSSGGGNRLQALRAGFDAAAVPVPPPTAPLTITQSKKKTGALTWLVAVKERRDTYADLGPRARAASASVLPERQNGPRRGRRADLN